MDGKLQEVTGHRREEIVAGLDEKGNWHPSFRTLWNLPPNSAIRLEGAEGGGYGNPMERDPRLVLGDVIEGYITGESALRDYGVVIDQDTTRINFQLTQQERKKRTG